LGEGEKEVGGGGGNEGEEEMHQRVRRCFKIFAAGCCDQPGIQEFMQSNIELAT